jgi:hypothetical protein
MAELAIGPLASSPRRGVVLLIQPKVATPAGDVVTLTGCEHGDPHRMALELNPIERVPQRALPIAPIDDDYESSRRGLGDASPHRLAASNRSALQIPKIKT